MSENSSNAMPLKSMIPRFAILLAVAFLVGFGGPFVGMTANQSTACAVFISIIFGTLFFWEFRLAVAFLGLAVLIFSKSLDIPTFVSSSSLEVIMFLVGMMVIVGALRDLGFFTWIVQLIVSMPHLNGRKFIFVTAVASALLACAVDEVTSIIFISTLIFQVCDRLKLNPTPYILIAVLATNIGSSGTMMGNPVGIFIGTKGQLTFGDFMVWSFPMMLASLVVTTGLLLWFYRKDLKQFDVSLKDRLSRGLSIAPVVKVPYGRGLLLLVLTVVAIASHHQTETLLELEKNSVLLVMPLICAGIVMILKSNRARHYIEKEVDWWTLIFFMLLFAVAGTLEHTHVDQLLASGFSKIAGKTPATLVPFIFSVSAVGSAFVDNVIFVAAFSPVIEQLAVTVKDLPLWWALLFGACFGGNITMIGSTANIVALGMLEKHGGHQVSFFQWLKVGLLCTVVSGGIAVGTLLALAPKMPDHHMSFEKLKAGSGYVPVSEPFEGELVGTLSQRGNDIWLTGRDGGKIRALVSEGTGLPSGSVRVSGKIFADKANKEYPYLMKVEKLEALKRD
ncbi:MAG: hypothetical protein E7055_16480 [Lentisphaerae bacterium]|nr:hypothetical protein [Lentisphaerota bacterium]